jgi:hypothetical protein
VITGLSPLNLIAISLCCLLVGANIALLLNLGGRLAQWFRMKIVAVTLLLVYVATSAAVGHPAPWRITVGFVALAIDAAALAYMWRSINMLVTRGEVGLVPLIRSVDEDYEVD